MKTTKRFLSIVIIAMMTFCLSAFNVSADDWSYTITLNDNNTLSPGQEFIAYKVFDLTQNGGAFSYTPGTDCIATNYGEGYSVEDLTGETQKDSDKMLAFGKILAGLIQALPVNNSVKQYTSENKVITIDEKGYYAIFRKDALTINDGSENAGENKANSFVALISCPENSTATSSTINLKEAIPTLDKKIWHNENGAWELVGDNQIGDEVNFRLETTVQDNMKYFTDYDYIIHDNLDPAFTLDTSSIKVYVGGTNVSGLTNNDGALLTAGTDYNVTTTGLTDGCDFEVKVLYSRLSKLNAGDKIYTYYKAKLNGNPIKIYNNDQDANQNTAWLEYTNDPHVTTNHGKTPPKKVDDWTFIAKIKKVASEQKNGEWESLDGAKFKVYKSENGNPMDEPTFMKFSGSNGVYTVSKSDSDNVEELDVSSAQGTKGQLILNGLDDGVTYYLRETHAPDGYKKLTTDVKLKLSAVYPETYVAGESKPNVSIDDKEDAKLNDWALAQKVDNELLIKNISGTALVGTGGIGTTIFYIAGGVLMAGAVVLLVVKRRVNK